MASYSGFWDNGATIGGTYALQSNKMPRRNAIRRVANREGFRKLTALINGLTGAATGSNVTSTTKKVGQDMTSAANGGARTIDTVTVINRNTAAADVTAIKEMLYNVRTRPTYPRDLSGNGGPAFT